MKHAALILAAVLAVPAFAGCDKAPTTSARDRHAGTGEIRRTGTANASVVAAVRSPARPRLDQPRRFTAPSYRTRCRFSNTERPRRAPSRAAEGISRGAPCPCNARRSPAAAGVEPRRLPGFVARARSLACDLGIRFGQVSNDAKLGVRLLECRDGRQRRLDVMVDLRLVALDLEVHERGAPVGRELGAVTAVER